VAPQVVRIHKSDEQAKCFFVRHLSQFRRSVNKPSIRIADSHTLSSKIATTNGRPWQYPTCGSYLPNQVKGLNIAIRSDAHRVCLENVEQIFLPYTLPVRKELMLRESPGLFSTDSAQVWSTGIPAKITCDCLLMGARLLQKLQVRCLHFGVLGCRPSFADKERRRQAKSGLSIT
jgi:hypothetical protein